MNYLKESGSQIFVDCYGMEVYLPYDYNGKSYRGADYYSVIGNKVRFFGVGNMRFFTSQKEMDSPSSVKTYTLGYPMMITSIPTEIDTRDVQFVKNGVVRKCIVLTFYRNDVFMDNVNSISLTDNVMIYLARMEGGKLDHINPDEAMNILRDVQSYNGLSLRIPEETEEIFVTERYRDPNNHSRKIRFADQDKTNFDREVSLNLRQEAMKTSSYQALTHEDINTSLITSINRYQDGEVDEPLAMERVVRGLNMDDLKAERDARIAAQQKSDKKDE